MQRDVAKARQAEWRRRNYRCDGPDVGYGLAGLVIGVAEKTVASVEASSSTAAIDDNSREAKVVAGICLRFTAPSPLRPPSA
jgi:hypothetical protein